MKKKNRFIAVLLALALTAMFAGCGGSSAASSAPASAAGSETASAAAEPETAEAEPAEAEPAEAAPASAAESETAEAEPASAAEDTTAPEAADTLTGGIPAELPLAEEKQTLTFFNTWNPVDDSLLSDMEDYVTITDAEEMTNVHIDWTYGPAQNYSEMFNIMVASGDYCDLISGFNYCYTSGVAGGIADEVIINFYDYLEEDAPAYSAIVDSIDYGWAQVSCDSDTVGAFYTLLAEPDSRGMLIRGDWLDELGLDAPETVDEYTDVLTAMKNEYGCYGFMLSSTCDENYAFASAYGTPGYSLSFFGSGSYWYQVDGEVKNALEEDGYKEYLQLMNQYYEAGLISPDFISVSEMGNDPDKLSDMANGVYASYCITGKTVDTVYDMSTDENIKLTACKWPVLNSGDNVHLSGYAPVSNNASAVSISTQCEDVELAVKWLDFWYTDEGMRLANFGEEGMTYNVVDGEVQYTDLILESEYSLETATQLYVPIGMIATNRINVHSSYTDVRNAAEEVWNSNMDHDYVLPNITLTTAETEQYNEGLADLETYAKESIPAFINGTKSFDEWDSFVQALKDLGLEEKIEIYQGALDRMK